MARLRRRALVLVVLAGFAPRLAGHEIALQQSTVDFLADGTWHISINTDPLVVLAPEARAVGADPRAAYAALADDERRARLERVRALFADNVTVRFDGVAVAATIRIPSAEPVEDEFDRLCEGVVLSGRIPAGAHAFTISTTTHLSPMVLVLRRAADDEQAMQAVASGGTSEPYRLDGGGPRSRLGVALRMVVAAACAVGAGWGGRAWYRKRRSVPASLAIAAVAALGSAQRLMG